MIDSRNLDVFNTEFSRKSIEICLFTFNPTIIACVFSRSMFNTIKF